MAAIAVHEQSQVAQGRRAAGGLAKMLAFSEEDAERVSLVTTELATNLVRHTVGGHIFVSAFEIGATFGVEILAIDGGPGMGDLEGCLRDGHSTAGGAGTGLGAVRRLSDFFEAYTRPNQGSALLARLTPRRKNLSAEKPPLLWGAIEQPKPGEETSGDAWSVRSERSGSLFMVADGLGHGPMAARAGQTAVQAFQKVRDDLPSGLLRAMHGALAGTRGAAAAVARIEIGNEVLTYSGIGNIAAAIVGPTGMRKAVSHNGILGHAVRKVQEFRYNFPREAVLVMHSDGLTTNWDLGAYTGLLDRDPTIIAGVLWRDHRRGRDDTVVLVARRPREGWQSDA